MSPKEKLILFNNDNTIFDNNNNYSEYLSRNIKTKRDNYNKNINQINSGNSSVNNSPVNYSHNIRNYQQVDNYTDNQKRNKFKNKRNQEENNNNYLTPKENLENTVNNSNNSNIIFNKDIKQHALNKKSAISLNYLERNTISYLDNPEEIENNDKHIFTLSELFSRDNLSNTLNKCQKFNSIKGSPRNNIYLITDNNGKKGELFYKKLNLPINVNNNQKNTDVNNKIISINYNNLDIDDDKDEIVKKAQNPNIYYNKGKIYHKSIPKINRIKDCYNNNNMIMSNHSKESQNTISSKMSYMEFNIGSLSSFKKSGNNNYNSNKININNLIQRNRVLSSSIKNLSNSFNKDLNNNKENEINNNKYNNHLYENNNENNNEYKKNSSKDLNKKIKNEIGRNANQNVNNINHLNSCENDLFFYSKNVDKCQIKELIYSNINTGKNNALDKRPYIKPLQKSLSKNKTNNLNKKTLYRKKNSQKSLTTKNNKINDSMESTNKENTYNNNYNIINYIKKIVKQKKNQDIILNDIYSNNQLNLKKETDKIDDNMNVQNIEDNNLTKNVDISDYYTLDKTSIHCFYQKLYKFYIKVPIKTICFIKKINKKTKNKNIVNKNKINIKNKSSFNYSKNKEIRLENIKFNGKNIIAKIIDNSGISIKKKKSNGSKKLFNLELFKEKEENPPNINNNELNSINKTINLSETKNINQNKNLQIFLDNNICKNINKQEFYENNLTTSTSQIHPKFYDNQFTENNELPKHIKICLATKKLSNILLTKNENVNVQKKRSITEVKFALGCSKLNNILNKNVQINFQLILIKTKKLVVII